MLLKVGRSKISSEECAFTNSISKLDYRQMGSALGTGGVNTVCSLEWVHRRHLLAVRPVNEQSLLFTGTFERKHINPWELENLNSFLRRVRRARIQARRLLLLVDSRMALGTASTGGSSPEITFLLRELGFWWLVYAIALRLVWVTAWGESARPPLYETSRSRFGFRITPCLRSVSHCRLRSRRKNMCVSLNPPVASV